MAGVRRKRARAEVDFGTRGGTRRSAGDADRLCSGKERADTRWTENFRRGPERVAASESRRLGAGAGGFETVPGQIRRAASGGDTRRAREADTALSARGYGISVIDRRLVVAASAAQRRSDGRRIRGVKGVFRAFYMKIGPAFQQPDAAVPAENAVVVARRANFFSLGKAMHSLFHQRQEDVGSVADQELRLGAPFVQQAAVVEPLIGIPQTLKTGLRFSVAIAGSADELVGDGESEHAPSELMVRVNGEDVAADGFGLLGLVEVAVKFGFGDGLGNAGLGDRFQLMLHKTSRIGEKRWRDNPAATRSALCRREICGRAWSTDRKTRPPRAP